MKLQLCTPTREVYGSNCSFLLPAPRGHRQGKFGVRARNADGTAVEQRARATVGRDSFMGDGSSSLDRRIPERVGLGDAAATSKDSKSSLRASFRLQIAPMGRFRGCEGHDPTLGHAQDSTSSNFSTDGDGERLLRRSRQRNVASNRGLRAGEAFSLPTLTRSARSATRTPNASSHLGMARQRGGYAIFACAQVAPALSLRGAA
jgi:hypothetical protein